MEKTIREQVKALVEDGLYRVEKDADGSLWGLRSEPGKVGSWESLDLPEGTETDNALEEQGLMTVMPADAGSVGFGV
jgi:hypothetical protein